MDSVTRERAKIICNVYMPFACWYGNGRSSSPAHTHAHTHTRACAHVWRTREYVCVGYAMLAWGLIGLRPPVCACLVAGAAPAARRHLGLARVPAAAAAGTPCPPVLSSLICPFLSGILCIRRRCDARVLIFFYCYVAACVSVKNTHVRGRHTYTSHTHTAHTHHIHTTLIN